MGKNFQNDHNFVEIQGIANTRYLASILGINEKELIGFAKNSSQYYHPTKKEIKGKEREIDRPERALKIIQRRINDRILCVYPLSEVVYGAVRGKSPRNNASLHVGQPVVVRIDLKDCFHSTKKKWVYATFRQRFHYSERVAKCLTEVCTYNNSVPVGSPLSSMLVNVVFDELWCRIEKICKEHDCILTVWVDDVVVSGAKADLLIEPIKKIINERGLKIGWKKLKIQRRNKQQEVTGHVVNTKVSVPRRKIRQYARTIRQLPNTKENNEILGQLAFVRYANPKQARQLEKLISSRQHE